ncbi:hypothetical protein ADU80_13760 [Clostridium botulinum]|uniref:Serine protease n=1 Tax=Clostridium botulinum TaxID=1491 RepID=A0A9Q1UXH8_CLOBO|nr:hypothetical protein [Clostridium botulinum]KEH95971.1 hypothetical protein Y848_p0147 [Clostridium botulinum C/D str. Sp77]KOA73583.1 hypothetical protein ADU77_13595 [Clostridium botulinum]KOA82129.1 hypothetical protein ADU75_13070 [Clostridium botulinum]KOA82616.1 hypothetical protein ADU80_13760 [Clostridium botulinum]KOA85920.1 hypothetical protein ADU74_09320 [Clostridium botulinum]
MNCNNVNTCCCKSCNDKTLQQRISYISSNEYKFFLNKSNVVGVGLGYKIKNGFNTFQKCLSIFVANKVPSCYLSSNDMIPSYYNGILTNVVNTGAFHLQKLTKKIRPVTAGYDIGPALIHDGGTLGCIVTDGKYHYILTCNHTLTVDETLPLNYSITQPSFIHGGKSPEDTIATLSKFIPFSYSASTYKGINYVDCAIAKVTQQSKISNKITFLGGIKGITKPSLGLNIQKVGETTELTKGTITSLNATIEFHEQEGKSIFLNQIITSKMCKEGDSGSILLDNNMHAIGLFMSGSSTSSTFNPIETVLSALDVKLVTN